jgi:hypothetical protein
MGPDGEPNAEWQPISPVSARTKAADEVQRLQRQIVVNTIRHGTQARLDATVCTSLVTRRVQKALWRIGRLSGDRCGLLDGPTRTMRLSRVLRLPARFECGHVVIRLGSRLAMR